MKASKRCLDCNFTVETSPPPGQIPLIGQRVGICTALPPTAQLVNTEQGVSTINVYPTVNAESLSCGYFEPRGDLIHHGDPKN